MSVVTIHIPAHSQVGEQLKKGVTSSESVEKMKAILKEELSSSELTPSSLSAKSISPLSLQAVQSLEGEYYHGLSALNQAQRMKGILKKARSIPVLKNAIAHFEAVITTTDNVALKFNALCKKLDARRSWDDDTVEIYAEWNQKITRDYFTQLSSQEKIEIGRLLYARMRSEELWTEKGRLADQVFRKWCRHMVVDEDTAVSSEGSIVLQAWIKHREPMKLKRVRFRDQPNPFGINPAMQIQYGKEKMIKIHPEFGYALS